MVHYSYVSTGEHGCTAIRCIGVKLLDIRVEMMMLPARLSLVGSPRGDGDPRGIRSELFHAPCMSFFAGRFHKYNSVHGDSSLASSVSSV